MAAFTEEDGQVCGDYYCGKVLMFIDNSYYNPTDGNNIQGTDMTLAGMLQIGGSASIGGDLNVLGNTTLAGLTVTGNVAIEGNLTIAGNITTQNITINGHVITGGGVPNVTVESVYDINNVQVSVSGNDTTGKVVITTTAQNLFSDPNWANSADLDEGVALLALAFEKEFGANPRVLLSPSNANAARLGAFAKDESQNGFKVYITQLPAGGKTYEFTYWVAQ